MPGSIAQAVDANPDQRRARAAFADAAVRKRLPDLDNELPPETDQTPEAMARFLSSEIEKWPVIKKAGITAQ
jgi:hypothetical protein